MKKLLVEITLAALLAVPTTFLFAVALGLIMIISNAWLGLPWALLTTAGTGTAMACVWVGPLLVDARAMVGMDRWFYPFMTISTLVATSVALGLLLHLNGG